MNAPHRLVCFAAGVIFSVFIPQLVLAQGQIFIPPIHPPEITPPLPISQQKIEVEIIDRAASTSIDQVFHNPHNSRLEGTYIFPVPKGVSISKLTMVVNGEPVSAKIVDANQARETYENIVRSQRDPALLEYIGQDLIRLRVFPIEPKSDVKIKVAYEEVLPYDNATGRYRFAFARPGQSQEFQASRVIVRIKTQGELKTIYSPSHNIRIERPNNNEAKVEFSDENITQTKDFELVYGVSPDDVALHLLTYRDDDDEDGYFMLLATPRQGLEEQDRVAKRVVFVLDTSGSMNQDKKIEQAKNALLYCLQNLKPEDRFGLITFSDEVTKLSDSIEDANGAAIEKAVAAVKKIEANGGTHIDEALEEALQMLNRDDERPAYVLFLTDGCPTVGEQNIDKILAHTKEENRINARVFSFGVGFDVNTNLLDRLATEHRAVVTYVRPKEDIEVAVSSLYGKISHPVLTNPELDFGTVEVSKVYPRPLPDVFAGQQMVLLGRYEDGGESTITLKGKTGTTDRAYKAQVQFAKESDRYAFIPRLWAARRIGYLSEQLQSDSKNQELIDEIKALSKEFGIVTPWTSMLITDDMPQTVLGLSEELLRQTAVDSIRSRLPERSQTGLVGSLKADMYDNRVSSRDAVHGVAESEVMPQQAPQSPDTQSDSIRVYAQLGPHPGNGMMGMGMGGAGTTGAAAVGQSMTVQNQLKEARQLGDALVFYDYQGNRQTVQSVQQVGKTNFYQVGDAWVQDGYDFKIAEDKIVKIKPFSQAYFDLVKAVPELSPWMALGNHLYLNYKGHQIAVVEGGLETIERSQIEAIQNAS